MLKYFFVVLGCHLGFALFESAILSNIMFLPVVPDFLLLCSLYVSFAHGRCMGVISGFSSGVIIDFLSGCPFGLNSLLRTVIGYISGFFPKTFNIKTLLLPVLIAFCGTFSKCFLISFISFFYPNIVNSYTLFSKLFFSELFFNCIFAPVMFKFMSIFDSVYSDMGSSAV